MRVLQLLPGLYKWHTNLTFMTRISMYGSTFAGPYHSGNIQKPSTPAALRTGLIRLPVERCCALSNLQKGFAFSTSSPKSAVSVALQSWKGRIWDVWQKIKKKIRMSNYKKADLRRAGTIMYSCCTDPLNHLHFFDVLGLPDTFNSWFKVTELHVWMCLVRLSIEDYDGKFVRNEIVKNFWNDVDRRSRELGQAAMFLRKKQVKILADQFRASLFGYDEGLLCDDKVLAAAMWRVFFGRECDDPRKIELLVLYARKQIENLEMQDRFNILKRGIVKWIPINEVK